MCRRKFWDKIDDTTTVQALILLSYARARALINNQTHAFSNLFGFIVFFIFYLVIVLFMITFWSTKELGR